VWNRIAARAAPLAAQGARLASTPAEAAEGVDVLLTMLTTGDDQARGRAVVAAASLRLDRDGDDRRRMDRAAGEPCQRAWPRGHRRAGLRQRRPGSRGRACRSASSLDEVREPVQPIFDVIGSKSLRLGPAGNGSRLRPALNNWLASQVDAVAETIALPRRSGSTRSSSAYDRGDGARGDDGDQPPEPSRSRRLDQGRLQYLVSAAGAGVSVGVTAIEGSS
jgi:3-hydroxyisobutyrate dehydrogenase